VIVLDTNVISELARPAPFPAVLAWARRQMPEEVFTTSICEAELLFGIALMPAGRRRDALARALTVTLTSILGGRVLPFDRAAAQAYAELAAQRRRTGRTVGLADLQTAAIALARGAAAIATRNVADFQGCGVPVINPWDTA
jgi:toxin FitB